MKLNKIAKQVLRESLMKVTTQEEVDKMGGVNPYDFLDDWNEKNRLQLDEDFFINKIRTGRVPSYRVRNKIYVDPNELAAFFKSSEGRKYFSEFDKEMKSKEEKSAYASKQAKANYFDPTGPRPGSNLRGD